MKPDEQIINIKLGNQKKIYFDLNPYKEIKKPKLMKLRSSEEGFKKCKLYLLLINFLQQNNRFYLIIK